MADLLDVLFDPGAPVHEVSDAAIRSLNAAKMKRRAFTLLRTRPISGERVPLVATLLEHLGVSRNAAELRSICADDAAPAVNRAAPAFLLLEADLDCGVPPERLPMLAEALLIGSACLGDIAALQPILPALCASGVVDVAALVERLERWRLRLAAPAHLVYGGVLESARCAEAHAAVLSVVERDPDVDDVVRRAAQRGALDRELASAFLARGVELAPPSGRAWTSGRCHGCGGVRVGMVVDLGGATATLSTHLSPERARDSAVVSLLGDAERDRFFSLVASDPSVVEVPLERVVTTARTARGETEWDERLLWLLRRFTAGAEGLEFPIVPSLGMHRPLSTDLEDVDIDELATRLAQDPDNDDDRFRAFDELCDAVEFGEVDPMAPDPAWLRLLDAYLHALERVPLRWNEPVPAGVRGAWYDIHGMFRPGDLVPAVADMLPVERRDRLTWRDLLLSILEEYDSGYLARELPAAIEESAEALARLGYGPRDVTRALGAPDAVAVEIAEMLGIDVDAPFVPQGRDVDRGR